MRSGNCKSSRELRIEELADQVRALSAENERLRDELYKLSDIAHKWDAFEAGCDEALKDAERWRAAKQKFTHLAYEHRWQYTDQNGCDAEASEMEFLELNDAAIDEAMKDG